MDPDLWHEFWLNTAKQLGVVVLSMVIVIPAMRYVLTRLLKSKATFATYRLYDGAGNGILVDFPIAMPAAERERIMAEYAKVLASYAPAFNLDQLKDLQPEMR